MYVTEVLLKVINADFV